MVITNINAIFLSVKLMLIKPNDKKKKKKLLYLTSFWRNSPQFHSPKSAAHTSGNPWFSIVWGLHAKGLQLWSAEVWLIIIFRLSVSCKHLLTFFLNCPCERTLLKVNISVINIKRRLCAFNHHICNETLLLKNTSWAQEVL